MAYMYCTKCDAAQDAPTARQLLDDEYACHSCHEALTAPFVDDKAVMLHLLGRIEELESALNITPSLEV